MAMAIIRFMTVSLILLFASALPARAQEDYRFAIGGGLGMTGYLGDANTANLLKNPSWDAEVLFDYLISPRLTLRTRPERQFGTDDQRVPQRRDLQVLHHVL